MLGNMSYEIYLFTFFCLNNATIVNDLFELEYKKKRREEVNLA